MKLNEIKEFDLIRVTDKQDAFTFYCVAKGYDWRDQRLDYHAALMHGRFIMKDFIYLCAPIVEPMTESERQMFIDAVKKEDERAEQAYVKAKCDLDIIKKTLSENGK